MVLLQVLHGCIHFSQRVAVYDVVQRRVSNDDYKELQPAHVVLE